MKKFEQLQTSVHVFILTFQTDDLIYIVYWTWSF